MAACPFSGSFDPSRRRALFGLAGGALALSASPLRAETPATPVGAIPFWGTRQAGVETPAQSAATFVAFDCLAQDRAGLEQLLRTLTERIAALTAGVAPLERDPRFPPADSGLLGPAPAPAGLTVTVSAGASLFDARYGLQASKPRRLTPMHAFVNDSLEAGLTHGDLMLQICADTPDATLHALRDILKYTPDLAAPRWKVDAFRKAGETTPRNLLGFKDGTGNPTQAEADAEVWVRPGADEPAWTIGGSYQAVRVIRMFVERWDRTALIEQEQIIGRAKASGAPLGGARDDETPRFADDAKGVRTPLDAHIRLANPRTAEISGVPMLRRGYNYSRGLTKAGQLDMGLMFVSYQADLEKGFLAVQNRLNGEPLEEYIKPVGGGYFFVLPGAPTPGRYLGDALLASA